MVTEYHGAEVGLPVDRTYRPDVAEIILGRMASGESLRSICRDEGMPPESTVRTWAVDDVEGFGAQYARAKELRADALFDELMEIADTPERGVKVVTKADGSVERTEADMIEHRRLRYDARKWSISKILPKVYGESLRQEHSGPGGGPIQHEDVRAPLTDFLGEFSPAKPRRDV